METDVSMEASGGDRNFPLSTNSTLNWFVPQHQAPGPSPTPIIQQDHMVQSQGTVTPGSHQKPKAGPNTPGQKLESNSAEYPTTIPARVGELCGPPTKVLDTWNTKDIPPWGHCLVEISLEFTSQSPTGADGLSQPLAPPAPVRDRSFPPSSVVSTAQAVRLNASTIQMWPGPGTWMSSNSRSHQRDQQITPPTMPQSQPSWKHTD